MIDWSSKLIYVSGGTGCVVGALHHLGVNMGLLVHGDQSFECNDYALATAGMSPADVLQATEQYIQDRLKARNESGCQCDHVPCGFKGGNFAEMFAELPLVIVRGEPDEANPKKYVSRIIRSLGLMPTTEQFHSAVEHVDFIGCKSLMQPQAIPA